MAFDDPLEPIVNATIRTDNPPNQRIEITRNGAKGIAFYSGSGLDETHPAEVVPLHNNSVTGVAVVSDSASFPNSLTGILVSKDLSSGASENDIVAKFIYISTTDTNHTITLTNDPNGGIVLTDLGVTGGTSLRGAVNVYQSIVNPNEVQQNLTMGTGWSALAGGAFPAFKKDATGRVELRGRIVGDGTSTSLIGTLPVGYRPTTYLDYPGIIVAGTGVNQTAWISINTAGQVILNGNVTNAKSGVSIFTSFSTLP